MIDVPDRPDIQVRLIALEFFLRHCFKSFYEVGCKYSPHPLTNLLERGTGFEPATIALEERDSTVELPPPCCTKSLLPPANCKHWSLGPGLNR